MSNIKFIVRDRRHTEKEGEIEEILKSLGAKNAAEEEKIDVDVIIVHGNTDKPTDSGFLTHDLVEGCVEQGGLFLDYTTAGGQWSKDDERRYSGGFQELVQALEDLDGLRSTDTLLNELESRYREFELLSALSILSQGYLAVHARQYRGEEKMKSALDQMGWSEELMSSSMEGRVEKVVKPDWWHVFDDEDSLLEEAKEEWGEADGWSKVKDLIIRITGDTDQEDTNETDMELLRGEEDDEGDTEEAEPKPLVEERDRKLVAEAYCALAERLGGEPCQ